MGRTSPVKAVDTNILVRIAVEDDSEHLRIARKIIAEGVIVPLTVFLELGWVLRSHYRLGREQLNSALRDLLDIPTMHIANEPAIRAALDLHANGADFADVIHLVAARGSEAFVTFDQEVPDAPEIGVEVERVGVIEKI